MSKQLIIRQARTLMLRSLERVYPCGMTAKLLYQVMCTVDESYDIGLMRKDVAYLREKGYCELVGIGRLTIGDINVDSMTAVKLTADGLEVAQELKDDPALEI